MKGFSFKKRNMVEVLPYYYAVIHIATMQIGPVLLALPHAYAAAFPMVGTCDAYLRQACVGLLSAKLLSSLWLSTSSGKLHEEMEQRRLSRPDTPSRGNSSSALSSPGTVDYYDIAEIVGGKRLRSWVVGVQVATLVGTAIGEIIAVGQTMWLVFPESMDSLWWILAAGAACTAIGFIPNFHSFILLSVIGLTGTISSAVVIIVASVVEKVPTPAEHVSQRSNGRRFYRAFRS